MIILGLTGSIGMGKSTIAAMLKTLSVPVHDSDETVHGFFKANSPARPLIANAFPYYLYPNLYDRKTKTIKRKDLSALIFGNDALRIRLENIMHPLVQKSQIDFIRSSQKLGREIICLDIPLLFETGAESRVDYTLVASAPYAIQHRRVLARPNMNEKKFQAILQNQMPDGEKRARADFVIKTGLGLAYSMKELKNVLLEIQKKENTA